MEISGLGDRRHFPVSVPRSGRGSGAEETSGAVVGRIRRTPDPRLFQIAFQAVLLGVGVLVRDFALDPRQMAFAFAAGLATQWLWLKALKLEQKGALSAVITCFGVSLLLRADTLWVHPLAAAIAISSKFVLRVNGKHVYNPANLGVIVALSLLPGAWVSPGQWGNDVALAGWFVALGGARHAARAALGHRVGVPRRVAHARLAARRGARPALDDPRAPASPTAALLLFAFFMISDPMTIPNRRGARVGYALVVAAIAFAWQFALFRTNALLWALFIASPLVPLIDWRWPAARFNWKTPDGNAGRSAPEP